METMSKASRLTYKEFKDEETLDANVWGQLQEHIPLQTIYEKLSQEDLFHLRRVSKKWNHAALQWILPKPSFVTIVTYGHIYNLRFLKAIVTYNSALDEVRVGHQILDLIHVNSHVPPFEVEGLILCHNLDDLEERGVYNVHTRTWHAIPDGPEQSKILCACGLLVDTSVKPYTFKLIEGNLNFRTQIYDSKSKSWSTTSSRLPSSFIESNRDTLEYSCICNNNNVYMTNSTHKMWKYSLEDDKWTKLKFPKVEDRLNNPSPDNTLGVWEGRIFTTNENYKKRTVIVWELVDSETQEWVEYARMSKELFKWLVKAATAFLSYTNIVYMRSFFGDGYLLVCSWRVEGACTHELAVFNIATKDWQMVDTPRGHDEQEFESSHEGEDVDEDEDFDEDDYFDEVDDVDGHLYV